jgi:hypothetical protein
MLINCKKYALHAILILGLALPLSGLVQAQAAAQFHTEQEARQHCPKDSVVWVNTKTGVYHFKGQRWYGNTREGVYACRAEANSEGDRATRNGQ